MTILGVEASLGERLQKGVDVAGGRALEGRDGVRSRRGVDLVEVEQGVAVFRAQRDVLPAGRDDGVTELLSDAAPEVGARLARRGHRGALEFGVGDERAHLAFAHERVVERLRRVDIRILDVDGGELRVVQVHAAVEEGLDESPLGDPVEQVRSFERVLGE